MAGTCQRLEGKSRVKEEMVRRRRGEIPGQQSTKNTHDCWNSRNFPHHFLSSLSRRRQSPSVALWGIVCRRGGPEGPRVKVDVGGRSLRFAHRTPPGTPGTHRQELQLNSLPVDRFCFQANPGRLGDTRNWVPREFSRHSLGCSVSWRCVRGFPHGGDPCGDFRPVAHKAHHGETLGL